MKVREILDAYRLQTKDRKKPYLIDDDEAIGYLNEGVREAARRARLIVDSTTAGLAQLPVAAGEPVTYLSPKIISIRRARLASSGRKLLKLIVRDLDREAPGWDTTTSRSQPSGIVVDYETDALRLYPIPAKDDTLLLTVTREPLADVANENDEPEINARYIPGVIEWMKYRSFNNEDTDLHDPKSAGNALVRFENEFGPAIGAALERYAFENYDDEGEL